MSKSDPSRLLSRYYTAPISLILNKYTFLLQTKCIQLLGKVTLKVHSAIKDVGFSTPITKAIMLTLLTSPKSPIIIQPLDINTNFYEYQFILFDLISHESYLPNEITKLKRLKSRS